VIALEVTGDWPELDDWNTEGALRIDPVARHTGSVYLWAK